MTLSLKQEVPPNGRLSENHQQGGAHEVPCGAQEEEGKARGVQGADPSRIKSDQESY